VRCEGASRRGRGGDWRDFWRRVSDMNTTRGKSRGIIDHRRHQNGTYDLTFRVSGSQPSRGYDTFSIRVF